MVPLTTEPSLGSSCKDTVDGSFEILRSPVEEQVVDPIIYKVSTILGGWPWDFWSIKQYLRNLLLKSKSFGNFTSKATFFFMANVKFWSPLETGVDPAPPNALGALTLVLPI